MFSIEPFFLALMYNTDDLFGRIPDLEYEGAIADI